MPERIQRKRTKGWRMPDNTTYVGRPSKWGNPFVVRKLGDEFFICLEDGGEKTMVNEDRTYKTEHEAKLVATRLYGTIMAHIDVSPLRGRNLACWCKNDEPCHADILLKLANKERP